ncbi:SPOR domain-containing protein [Curvibacter sp. CHRR-16]|uniref:SPOR domain-containing protein n=1 Tax=Curvibacter sp. CHRR-16 TaxID=2835872 RepID=UPI001BDAC1B9|nr:SPOR domain-containing protein [Curvibacter sp. CHRR-16]MBT0569699.1 SPOR domain-containing protein [Curvibacter sp. CHRR-16]
MLTKQRGGTVVGFIAGLLVGLAIALVVAIYITKVPVPFVNKTQTRSAEQDAAEAEKNKNWDPNAPLYGKNPAPVPPTITVPGSKATKAEPTKGADAKPAEAKAPDPKSTPADAKQPASADPIADLAKAKGAIGGVVFWVQVGAYFNADEAEGQRAKLQISGIDTKVSQREQNGRTVYRVRVGPFDKKEDAEANRDKLEKNGLDAAVVRVTP